MSKSWHQVLLKAESLVCPCVWVTMWLFDLTASVNTHSSFSFPKTLLSYFSFLLFLGMWGGGGSDQVISVELFLLFDSWFFFFPFNSSCRGTFWMVQCPWPCFNVDFSNCTLYYPFPRVSTNTEKLLSCGSRDVGWEFLAYRVTQSSFSCLMHIGKKSATEFSHLSKSLLISSYSPCQLWNPS